MKSIKEKLPADRVADFEKGAQAYAKKIVADFKNYEFVGLTAFFFPLVLTRVAVRRRVFRSRWHGWIAELPQRRYHA